MAERAKAWIASDHGLAPRGGTIGLRPEPAMHVDLVRNALTVTFPAHPDQPLSAGGPWVIAVGINKEMFGDNCHGDGQDQQ